MTKTTPVPRSRWSGKDQSALTTPEGCAIITRVGWEYTPDGRQFTATLVFPNGAPLDIGYDLVWNKVPVRLVEVKKP